jgi:AmiR/NasT family two-component response regulator
MTEGVAEIAARRAVIERVKGVLMVVYDVDANTAFDVLRWRSQVTKPEATLLNVAAPLKFRQRFCGR